MSQAKLFNIHCTRQIPHLINYFSNFCLRLKLGSEFGAKSQKSKVFRQNYLLHHYPTISR